jgi:hypothetical protein
MSKRDPSTQDQALDERLRREAIESRPAFSESLHRRIAGAVSELHSVGIAAHPRPTRASRRQLVLATVLTAACLFVATAICWQLIGSHQRQDVLNTSRQIAGPSLDDLRVLGQWADKATATSGLDSLVASASLQPHAAKLEHDARLLADTFLDPLPVNVQLVNAP